MTLKIDPPVQSPKRPPNEAENNKKKINFEKNVDSRF